MLTSGLDLAERSRILARLVERREGALIDGEQGAEARGMTGPLTRSTIDAPKSANSGYQPSPVQRGRYSLDQTVPVWRAR